VVKLNPAIGGIRLRTAMYPTCCMGWGWTKELVRRAGARGGEIFGGFFSNARDKFSDFNV